MNNRPNMLIYHVFGRFVLLVVETSASEFPSPIFIFGIFGMLIFWGIKLYETWRMADVV